VHADAREGTPVVRIAEIVSGSIAEALELRVGTRIIRINGERVRDGIDFTFQAEDPELEVETVDPDGLATIFEISKDPGEPLGIIPEPDTIRECANKCVFCFIDGNPKDVRPSLWLRDDDFRLSFTYGSYVTLTNLGPKGLQRLVDQRISPLYVSVHATEPEVRIRLLVNEQAGRIMEHLRFFTDNGLEVHTQVVLCPEWNDGPHLLRTIEDLYGLGSGVRSLSIVPVGLTKYNLNRPVRHLTRPEARLAVQEVEAIRERALAERGYGWCYAADELFLSAGLELPSIGYYDDNALAENGVGAVRTFLDDFDAGLHRVPKFLGRRIRLLTGGSMAPFLRTRVQRLAVATGAEVEVLEIENDFYGPSVSTAGLLAGEDILRGIGEGREGDLILLSRESLNQDDLFVDSFPLSSLVERLSPARVLPGYEITETLSTAL
jgi:putative radical SAM enzyme (TIGR03279 family)